MRWFILDDNVYVLDGFLHPGGTFILEEARMREVGRFIYGAYGLEVLGDSTRHKHSSFAIKALEQYFVGKAINEYQIFSDASNTESLVNKSLSFANSSFADTKLPLFGTNDLEYTYRWKLVNKTQISSCIARYEFQNPSFRVRNRVNKIQHFGKHFKLYHKEHSSVRLYTVILALQQENIEFRNYLYKVFEDVHNLNVDLQMPSPYSLYSDVLPLVIKTYTVSTAFSFFLSNKETPYAGFSISGPYGLGLGLSHLSEGDHYIFAAGTGILPFLDLFDNLLRKAMYDIVKEKHGVKIANDLNIMDEELAESISSKLRFHVFLSFRELDDFAGRDIVEKLCEICKKYKSDLFRATVRVSKAKSLQHVDITNDKFDVAFVNKVVDSHGAKVFICGPPVFNGLIFGAVHDLGVPRENIIMV